MKNEDRTGLRRLSLDNFLESHKTSRESCLLIYLSLRENLKTVIVVLGNVEENANVVCSDEKVVRG